MKQSLKNALMAMAVGSMVLGGLQGVEAASINVLDLGSLHNSNQANIDGDFAITVVGSLSGVILGNFDVLYIDEHVDSAGFSGRENDVRNAMLAGNLGLAIEINFAGLGSINTILGTSFVNAGFVGSGITLTPAGTSHPTFTGTGIPGGSAVTVGSLSIGSRVTYTGLPSGATVLGTDDSSNPSVITALVGPSRYYLFGREPL